MTYNEAIAQVEVDELAEKVKRVAFLLKLCKEKLQNTNDQVEQILKEMED